MGFTGDSNLDKLIFSYLRLKDLHSVNQVSKTTHQDARARFDQVRPFFMSIKKATTIGNLMAATQDIFSNPAACEEVLLFQAHAFNRFTYLAWKREKDRRSWCSIS